MPNKVEVEIVPTVAKEALNGLSSALKSALVGGIGGLLGSLGLDAVASSVGKANPATMQLLTKAFDDMQAVVGHFLTPVIEFVTEAVRLFGDTLATMLPSAESMRDVMQSFRPILDDLRTSMESFAPFVRDVLVVSLKIAAVSLRIFVEAIRIFVNACIDAVRLLTFGVIDLKKLQGFHQGPLRSSFGAAAGQSQFIQAEDIGRSVITGALSRGTIDYAARTAEATADTAAILRRMEGGRGAPAFDGRGFEAPLGGRRG